MLTAVGLFDQVYVIEAAEDADARALAWHACLWDPKFAAWGIALTAALRLSRPGASR